MDSVSIFSLEKSSNEISSTGVFVSLFCGVITSSTVSSDRFEKSESSFNISSTDAFVVSDMLSSGVKSGIFLSRFVKPLIISFSSGRSWVFALPAKSSCSRASAVAAAATSSEG